MKLSSRLVATFLLLVAIPNLMVIAIVVFQVKQQASNDAQQALQLLAGAEEQNITNIAKGYQDRLTSITSRTKFRSLLASGTANEEPEIANQIASITSDAIEPFDDIEWIIVLDNVNNLIGTSGPRKDTLNDLDKNIINPDAKLSFHKELGVIIAQQNISREEELLGRAIIGYSPELITESINDYTNLGETGEVVVAQRDPFGNAEFIHTRRFEDDDHTRGVVDQRSYGVPITQALLEQELVMLDAVDYRDQNVIAATRYIESTDWGLVAKMDQQELFARVRSLQTTTLAISGIFFIFIIMMATFMARSVTNPIRKLTEITKKFSEGDLSEEIPKDLTGLPDEVGDLSRNFQTMQSQLSGLYKDLEQKVEERTRALVKSEKEAREKVDQLDRLNKVMIGREVKMAELKEKLGKLGNDNPQEDS